jgi:uncharacterized protein YciI
MQFMVLAYDGTDEGALARRLKAREAHLAGVAEMKKRGEIIAGGAILDEGGTMIGSVALVDFPDRAAVDRWLKIDPYVTGDVWRAIEVRPVKIAT